MRRWIAGMIVAGLWAGAAAGAEKGGAEKAESFSVTVQTRDGSRLEGAPAGNALRLGTVFGDLTVPLRLMARVQMTGAGGEMVAEFKNQDRLSGRYLEEWVVVKTAFGTQKIPRALVREIRIRTVAQRQGLIAHYPFDEDGGREVRDASGNGRDGEVRGAVYAPEGKTGGAYRVGRRTGHLQIPDDPAWDFGAEPFSFALWVKLDSPPYGEQMIVGHDDGGGEQNKWAFEFWNGNLCFHVNTPRSESHRIAAIPWRGQVGRWHHLAVTRAGERFRIYVDGAWVSEAKHDGPVPDAQAPLTIGQAEVLFIEGLLDEVMIFDRTLSDDEIWDLADAGD